MEPHLVARVKRRILQAQDRSRRAMVGLVLIAILSVIGVVVSFLTGIYAHNLGFVAMMVALTSVVEMNRQRAHDLELLLAAFGHRFLPPEAVDDPDTEPFMIRQD